MDALLIVAAGEAATGVSLILFPQLVVELLFGGSAAGAGLAMSRICGMALLGLGIACWPEVVATGQPAHARSALLVYGALAAIYLTALGLDGKLRGVVLWPAVIVHVVVTAVLARAWASIRTPMSVARRGGVAGRRRTRRRRRRSRSDGL